jgi:hypothetical protein
MLRTDAPTRNFRDELELVRTIDVTPIDIDHAVKQERGHFSNGVSLTVGSI